MKLRKHQMALLAAMAGFALLTSGSALAGNTNTLKVNANIIGTCNFNAADNPAGNATLDFGTLDQVTGGNVVAPTATLQYWCTKGTPATDIVADTGLNTAGCIGSSTCLSNGTDLIPYLLTVTPGGATGLGKTTPIDVSLDAGISGADYIDVSAGAYADTVTLTINP